VSNAAVKIISGKYGKLKKGGNSSLLKIIADVTLKVLILWKSQLQVPRLLRSEN
jgi:hypothetical protein